MTAKKLFRETDGIRGKANFAPLDGDTVLKIGKALAEYVIKKVKHNPNRDYKVIIGKDTRRSGYLLEQSLTAGFLSRGVDVMTVGPMPTPAISHLVKSFALDLGVMITASHNPYIDNGIKVFDLNGYKLSDKEELEIEDIFFNFKFDGSEKIGRAKRIEDVSGRYIEFIKAAVDNTSLNGLKIVVDCANGASYKTAPTVFSELGAKVIPVSVKPDGFNINVDCGSLYPEKLKKAVIREKADIGIALDGDADRVIMVDEVGNIIDGDYIIALVARSFQKEGKLNKDSVVITEYSNLALTEELEKNKVKVLKVVNGDRAIANLCRVEGLNFGGEQTGHFLFLDYSDTGDGTLSALIVMRIMKSTGKKLSELAYTFKKFPQKVFNLKVTNKIPLEELKDLKGLLEKWNRKFKGKGRIFLRYSGTENMLRIMSEAEDEKLMLEAGKEVMDMANKLIN
jgi:phosphoglucosamine mutase